MRLGVTGHQRLLHTSSWTWVRYTLEDLLRTLPFPHVGITSLAAGADQLFANVVLEMGGIIEVILPFEDYERTFSTSRDKIAYRALLSKALQVTVLPKAGSDEESYYVAGKKVVETSDMLFAVWDGKPARGLGGTADIVDYARSVGKRVLHINPIEYVVDFD